MSKLQIQFSGGLGNQLFTYVAFKHFEKKGNQSLVLDCSVVERVLGRNADILDFNLDGEKVIRKIDVNMVTDYLNRVSWRNSFTRRLFKRKLYPNINDIYDSVSSTAASSNRGFFQTYKYFALIALDDRKTWFELKNESENFKSLRDQMRREKPFALHVRRGDYREYQNSFGLLKAEYFLAGITRLEAIHGVRPIWVFSDEPELVATEFENTGLNAARYISPSELMPSETLKLMSLATAQVISNSTFSWWAGALSENQSVIYPEPWFKENNGWLRNNDLALPNWLAQKAIWQP